MEPVNILDARNSLSQLVAAAGKGADVVIAKRGKPVVRLVPVEPSATHTAAGAAAWLTRHHPPTSARSRDELDEQIKLEREGWE